MAEAPQLPATIDRVRGLAAAQRTASGSGWTWAQMLEHCAQSIEFSMDGFPRLKPAIVRATVGRLVAGRFLRKGALSHDPHAPIPGAPAPTADDPDAALARLIAAADRFERHEGALADHFIFGRLAKADYGRLHAMHIEDHLRARS